MGSHPTYRIAHVSASSALSDFAYAVSDARKALRKRRALCGMVALLLGLGIGGNAAMLSVLDRVWLQPPAGIVKPREVVRLYFEGLGKNGSRTTDATSYVHFKKLRRIATATFTDVAAYAALTDLPVGRGERAARAIIGLASANLFPLLGLKPALGRFYSASEDEEPSGAPVAVVSYLRWKKDYGGSQTILGALVPIGGTNYTIIGVTPEGFSGVESAPIDYWVPLSAAAHHRVGRRWYADALSHWVSIIARVRSPELAANVLPLDVADVAQIPPGFSTAVRVYSFPLAGIRNSDGSPSRTVQFSKWLAGLALLVFVCTAVNVIGLLLGDVCGRDREFALRISLGASRRRLFLQLMCEAIAMTAAGAIVALVLYWLFATLFRGAILPDIAWPTDDSLARILACALLLMFVTAFLMVAVSWAYVLRRDIHSALRGQSRSLALGGTTTRLVLIGGQASFATVLLIVSGLLVSTLGRVRAIDLGFKAAGVAVVTINLGQRSSREYAPAYARALERLRSEPGVKEGATVMALPFTYTFPMQIRPTMAESLIVGSAGATRGNGISASYFRVMRATILEGRSLEESDNRDAAPVVVVNATLAAILGRQGVGLGQCVFIDSDRTCTRLVGVIADIRQTTIDAPAAPEFFLPIDQRGDLVSPSAVVVGVEGNLDARLNGIRRAVLASTPGALRVDVSPMSSLLAGQMRPWELGAELSTVFASLAAIVALMGIHSAFAFYVATRMREFGIRVALGARGTEIGAGVMARSLQIAALGSSLGVLGVLSAIGLVRPLLFGVEPKDPLVFAVAITMVLTIAALGSLVPAMRAAMVDPVASIRAE